MNRPWRALPTAFWRTWLVVLVSRSAQFVEAFLPLLLLNALGATAAATAMVLVAQQAAATLAYAGEGWLVRRLGLIRVIRWGLAGSALAVAVLAISETMLAAGLGAAAFGATSGAWRTAIQVAVPRTLVAAASHTRAATAGADAEIRSAAYGTIFWAANLGAIASAGAGAAGVPLRVLFAVQALATGAAFVLTWILPRNLGSSATLPATPILERPSESEARRARRRVRYLVLAFIPATMLMFQAFSGLAVLMPTEGYRQMVLVNAAVLVFAQPVVTPLLRLLGTAGATIAAVAAMAVGISAQAVWPGALGWTVLWTLGELIIVIVPAGLVTAAVPSALAADHVGRFQVAQGCAAAVALYAGPLIAATGDTDFAVACLSTGALGIVAVLGVRASIRAAWRQPLTCPCGALFCVCSGGHSACANPSPVVTHQARVGIENPASHPMTGNGDSA